MRVTVPENITWKNLESGVVVLNLDSGAYYLLNDTASTAWRGIVDEKSDQDIRRTILDEFDTSPDKVEEDLEEMMRYLSEEGLIETSAA